MKRKSIISLLIFFIMVLSMARSLTARADDGEYVHVIYKDEGLVMTINGNYAFCYNQKKKAPSSEVLYYPSEPFIGQENYEDLQMKVNCLIYAGYPFDGFGYMASSGFEDVVTPEITVTSETQAYNYTQDALWILLGQWDAEEYLGPSSHMFENAKQYIIKLLNAASEEKIPQPGDLTISNGSDCLTFCQVEGGYSTEPVTLSGYSGTIQLLLPDGIQAYTPDGTLITQVETGQPFQLKSESRPLEGGQAELLYRYVYPKELLYYQCVHEEGGSCPYQNLISYNTLEGELSVPLSYQVLPEVEPTPVPTETPVPTPTPTPADSPSPSPVPVPEESPKPTVEPSATPSEVPPVPPSPDVSVKPTSSPTDGPNRGNGGPETTPGNHTPEPISPENSSEQKNSSSEEIQVVENTLSGTPATEDSSSGALSLWFGILLVSSAAIVAILRRK